MIKLRTSTGETVLVNKEKIVYIFDSSSYTVLYIDTAKELLTLKVTNALSEILAQL